MPKRFLNVKNVDDPDNKFCNLDSYNKVRNSVDHSNLTWSAVNLNLHHSFVNSKSVEITHNRNNGIMVLCYPHIMMIDFDEKKGFTKDDALDLLEIYTEKLEEELDADIFFRIYETDRGIHAFLTTHYVDPKSSDTMKALIQLCSDEAYAVFVTFRGFCIRISPKPLSKTLDFTSRRCYGDICGIGHGQKNEIPSIINKLDFHTSMILYFNKLYATPEIREDFKILESEEYIKIIEKEISKQAKIFKIDITGNDYPIKSKEIKYYQGFEKILEKKLLDKCKDISMEKITAMKFVVLKNFAFDKQIYILGKNNISYNIEKRTEIYISEDSISFKYFKEIDANLILGFDQVKQIFYLISQDMLTLDWDNKDGYTLEMVEKLLRNFIENDNRNLKKGQGLMGSPLTFRIYQTDNGTHAYCTSHRIYHDSIYAKIIMKSLCIDPWYIYFTSARGYSSRISPKKDKKNQFVFRPVMTKDGKRKIIGNGGENSILILLLNLKMEAKEYILNSMEDKQYGNFLNRLEENTEYGEEYFRKLGNAVIGMYEDLKNSTILTTEDVDNLWENAKNNYGETKVLFDEKRVFKEWELEKSYLL